MTDAVVQGVPHQRNFRLQAAGDASFVAGTTMASAEGVLTWFATHMSVSFLLAALIVPVCTMGNLGSVYYLSAHLTRVDRRRIAVVFLGSAVVGLLAVLAVILPLVSGYVGIALLLVVGAAYGMASGLFGIAQAELKKRSLTDDHIARAQLLGAGLGGGVTLALLFSLHVSVPGALSSHANLLWLAAVAWFGAVIAYGYVREMSAGGGRNGGRIRRLGLRAAARQRWFRGLTLSKLVFLSVELSVPFYVIHAATVHAPTLKNATTIVVALGIGYVVGGPLWSRLPRDRPWIGAAVAGVASALGGIAILFFDDLDRTHLLYIHFSALVVVAASGVGASRSRWTVMYKALPSRDREAALGTYAAIGAVLSIAVASLLGAAADLRDITWPLMTLVAANVAAAVFALTYLRRFWQALVDAPRRAAPGA